MRALALLKALSLTALVAGLALLGAVAHGSARPVASDERAVSAHACADRAALITALRERASREIVATARTGPQTIEVLVAPDGAWTMLVSAPRGLACVAAAGSDWSER